MYTNLDLCLISCYICLSYLAFWVKKFIKVMKLITDLIRTKRIQLWNPVDIRFDQSNQPGVIQLIIDKFFFFFFFLQVLELFLGSKDINSRASREGSMGPFSRQSSNASVSSCTSNQDAGTSQFFEVSSKTTNICISKYRRKPMFEIFVELLLGYCSELM